MRSCAILFALFLATLATVVTDAQAIHVWPIVEVARETEPRRFSEPHLTVQPGNADHLLAGAFIITAAGTAEQTSRDGGSRRSRHEFSFADCGDPQVVLFPDGQAVFLALA